MNTAILAATVANSAATDAADAVGLDTCLITGTTTHLVSGGMGLAVGVIGTLLFITWMDSRSH